MRSFEEVLHTLRGGGRYGFNDTMGITRGFLVQRTDPLAVHILIERQPSVLLLPDRITFSVPESVLVGPGARAIAARTAAFWMPCGLARAMRETGEHWLLSFDNDEFEFSGDRTIIHGGDVPGFEPVEREATAEELALLRDVPAESPASPQAGVVNLTDTTFTDVVSAFTGIGPARATVRVPRIDPALHPHQLREFIMTPGWRTAEAARQRQALIEETIRQERDRIRLAA